MFKYLSRSGHWLIINSVFYTTERENMFSRNTINKLISISVKTKTSIKLIKLVVF